MSRLTLIASLYATRRRERTRGFTPTRHEAPAPDQTLQSYVAPSTNWTDRRLDSSRDVFCVDPTATHDTRHGQKIESQKSMRQRAHPSPTSSPQRRTHQDTASCV
eukprot:1011766-Prymnesium_polylepis.1